MITQELVQELFVYDPKTGILVNRKNRYHAKAGQIAGCLNQEGYRYVKIKQHRYSVARIIWLYMTGVFPKEIDHVNRMRDDNRWFNLREASRSQNCSNKIPARQRHYRGVRRCSKIAWQAVIKVEQKDIFFGPYPTEEYAALAYDMAAKKYFGEFAQYNFPERAHRDWLLP